MKIVCVGDSLTYGYGVPYSGAWVNILKASCTYNIINKGVNGATTSSILCRSQKDILDCKPNYAIIMAGTNDFLMGYSLEATYENLLLLYKEAQQNSITPISIAPPPVLESAASIRWDPYINYSEVNTKLSQLSYKLNTFSTTNSLMYLNLFQSFNSYKENSAALYTDGVHLSIEGNTLIYKEITKLEVFNKKEEINL